MAKANDVDEGLRCSICHEVLFDPRPLPCGHSYCGPPRTCLNSMENNDGTMTCAICRRGFSQRAKDIKPLYGIRDLFRETEGLGGIRCDKHWSMKCNLWCVDCEVSVCDLCIQDDHDEHSVRNLRKYLSQKIERKLGTNMHEGILSHLTSLEKCVDMNSRMFPEVQKRYVSMNKFLEVADTKKKTLDRYFKSTRDGSTCGLPLLQELSEFDFTIPDSIYHEGAVKSLGVQVGVSKAESSTQTEHPANLCSCVQTESVSKFERLKETDVGTSMREIKSHLLQRPRIPIERELIGKRTTAIEFHLTIQSRKPSVILPSKVVQLGNFQLQVLAYSRVCSFHKQQSNCNESKLYLKVKRTWIQKERHGGFWYTDRCKIELINQKFSSKNIMSDWYNLNEENERAFLLYGNFLDPKNAWIDSKDIFHLKMLMEFYASV